MTDTPTLRELEQDVAYAAGAYILAYTHWRYSGPEFKVHHEILRDNAHDGLERNVIKWLEARGEWK